MEPAFPGEQGSLNSDPMTLTQTSMKKSFMKSHGAMLSPRSPYSPPYKPQVQYFADIRKAIKDSLAEGDLSYEPIEQNIDKILDHYGQVQNLLSDYDKKLLKVLDRHEQDFLAAYRAHMSKVEKELMYLKSKARDQENRLAQDERILRLEKQLQWFKDELDRLQKKKEENYDEIEMLGSKVQNMKDEKKFMEDQVKASKRQNKLLIVALNKTQQQKDDLNVQVEELKVEFNETRKQAVGVPMLPPFERIEDINNYNNENNNNNNNNANLQQSIQNNNLNSQNYYQDQSQTKDKLIENSIQISTEYHSDFNTSRHRPNDKLNEDIKQVTTDMVQQEESDGDTVIQKYICDLLNSGRTESEIVDSLEKYYHMLSSAEYDELHALQEELEIQKALSRELQADEVVLPAVELDDLSNYFIDCIYEERKSLRHQLLTMRQPQTKNSGSMIGDSMFNGPRTVSNVFNNSLLNTYVNTVRTGSQEEIEHFSQIEKQKLVQLLVTNHELLNFMFDKMFKNKKKPKTLQEFDEVSITNKTSQFISQNQDNNQQQQQYYSQQFADYNVYGNQGVGGPFINTLQQQSPKIYYQPFNQYIPIRIIKNNTQIFGVHKQNEPFSGLHNKGNRKYLDKDASNSNKQSPSQFRDKKHNSMVNTAPPTEMDLTMQLPQKQQQTIDKNNNNLTVNNISNNNNNDGGAAYFSASPLLNQNPIKSGGVAQSNILLSRIKESNFNTNILSQIDTDYLQQQYISQEGVLLNDRSPTTEKEIMFQQSKIYMVPQNKNDMTYNSAQIRSKSIRENGLRINKNRIRRTSVRPIMQIKNGKLLLAANHY